MSKPAKFKDDTIHIKLRDNSGVSLQAGEFRGGSVTELAKLRAILAGAGHLQTDRLTNDNSQSQLQADLKSHLQGYYRLKLKHGVDVLAVVKQLKALNIVEEAYAEPTAAPLPTASYVSLQNYLQGAPQGISDNYARTFPGGAGYNVHIFDLEYNWNTSHEDLTKAAGALIPNGTPVDPFNDNNHGTAVLGEMVSDNNSFGVTGAASSAPISLINVNNTERGYDPAGALLVAAAHAKPGDVIIIEQQSWGPTPETYDFVPIEWIPEVYTAIQALTANNITVIEPAANGSQNLDDQFYYGPSFPLGKPDSGAIIVGAGLNCATSPRLSRAGFSDYGARVNVQGPGECVTTTGYGDLANNGANALYTQFFGGTSSASPVVAAAAADLSSAYIKLNGTVATSAQIRSWLMSTGTAQVISGAGVLTGNIGPYPNLIKALQKADLTAPTKPTNVKVVLNSSKQPLVTWSASTDNVRVTSYRLYRNGVIYKVLSNATSYTDTSVTSGQTYSYKLTGGDAAGHYSGSSATVTITVK